MQSEQLKFGFLKARLELYDEKWQAALNCRICYQKKKLLEKKSYIFQAKKCNVMQVICRLTMDSITNNMHSLIFYTCLQKHLGGVSFHSIRRKEQNRGKVDNLGI